MDNLRDKISKILLDVRKNGDSAVCRYIRKFDGIDITPGRLTVRKTEMETGCAGVDKKIAASIIKAAGNIEYFHRQELKQSCKSWNFSRKGVVLGQSVSPIGKVGIYVPGGSYSYYSTLLMCAIPARVAGVSEITAVTPPGNITPELLFAAKISGIKRIFRAGGPAAIAALAYGTETIPCVDLIAGPGNIYVTEAKRQVFGDTGIDMLAGPSEIAILCEGRTADARCVITDLLAQAEHDANSKAYLFCDDIKFINTIKKLIPASMKPRMAFLRENLDKSVEMINKIAPEHLEIIHSRAEKIAGRIRNAGAVFMGIYSPVVSGDYIAGPSHVLPTNRTARFSSGVSVKTFLKHSSIIRYSREAFLRNRDDIIRMSLSEGLKFHSESSKARR